MVVGGLSLARPHPDLATTRVATEAATEDKRRRRLGLNREAIETGGNREAMGGHRLGFGGGRNDDRRRKLRLRRQSSIINDRGVGGKCYGFVTFTNPRSAVNAINDMDGRTVDGRVVKVNEVKTRSGRSNFGHDNFRHNNNRDIEFDRGRDRDYGRERDRSRDQNREWSRDRDQGKERGFDRTRDVDRSRDRFVDRDRGHDRDKDLDDIDLEHERDHNQSDVDQDKDMIRSGNKYKDQPTKLTNGSDTRERHSREYPSGSSHGDHDQVAKQLDISRQRIEELQKEVIHMEELVEERGDHVSKLREKSQKLEDVLASARKLTSNRKKQLIKDNLKRRVGTQHITPKRWKIEEIFHN
ncbi:hypothetical protein E3N88_29044 [Mikania micrantha]|uniref:RRM domain-containing protein n=1 Tax=Mikania micrantha TaxID=192012 RepID=A0A5N6N175_9ASTR|nr:hypothetical protein E3N88_29044 [Mikania micrantha]